MTKLITFLAGAAALAGTVAFVCAKAKKEKKDEADSLCEKCSCSDLCGCKKDTTKGSVVELDPELDAIVNGRKEDEVKQEEVGEEPITLKGIADETLEQLARLTSVKIKELDEAVEEFSKREAIKDGNEKLKADIEKLTKAISDLNNSEAVKEGTKKLMSVYDSIRAKADTVKSMLDELEEDIHNDMGSVAADKVDEDDGKEKSYTESSENLNTGNIENSDFGYAAQMPDKEEVKDFNVDDLTLKQEE